MLVVRASGVMQTGTSVEIRTSAFNRRPSKAFGRRPGFGPVIAIDQAQDFTPCHSSVFWGHGDAGLHSLPGICILGAWRRLLALMRLVMRDSASIDGVAHLRIASNG